MSKLFHMMLVLLLSGTVQASQLPDLSGATLIDRGFCSVDENVVECMEVAKDGKFFVIFYIDRTIIFIFRVKEGAEKPYAPGEMEQIFPVKGTAI